MARLALSHPGVAVIAALGFSLNPMSADMTLASLPGMVRYFGITVSQAQATLSAFVAAFAVSQLLYGPLSDRVGRRPMLLWGTVVYVVGSVACALALTIEVLIAARFVQGFGCCAATVVGRALIRDVHGPEGTGRMMALIGTGMSVFFVLGPVAGGLLEQHFGWRSVFVTLALFGVATVVLIATLVEESNLEKDATATRPGTMAANYRMLLSNRRFVGYTVIISSFFAAIFAFLSGSPFIMLELLRVTPTEYGLLLGVCVFAFTLSSLYTGRHILRMGARRLLAIGTPVAALAGTAMIVCAAAGIESVAAVFVPYMLFLFAAGFVQPTAVAGALAPFPRIAGTASSLLGMIQLTVGAAVGYLVGLLHDGTPLPMAAAFAISCWGMLLGYRLISPPARSGR